MSLKYFNRLFCKISLIKVLKSILLNRGHKKDEAKFKVFFILIEKKTYTLSVIYSKNHFNEAKRNINFMIKYLSYFV